MNKAMWLSAVAVLLGVCAAAWADEIHLHDGRVFQGRIKSESALEVVFEVHRYGMVAETRFRRSEIKKIIRKELPKPKPAPKPKPKPVVEPAPTTQPEPTGPTYFLVPLHGVVGQGILASKLKEALDAGLEDADTVLILGLDSPGGLLSECEEVLKLLAEHRQRRSIAFIKSAYSAAAIIALTCDEIYMQSTASIGAATAYQKTPWGSYAVSEKMQSVWRSICRTAADIGGHNSLIPEAMVDRHMRLRIIEKDGKPDVEQFLKTTEADLKSRTILTERGKLLTMTAKESVRCGLAAGVADNMEQLAQAAKLSGWRPASKAGEQIMAAHEVESKDAEKKIKQYKQEGEKAWNLANANDPERGHYSVDFETGKFTPRSRKEWLRRSVKCFNYLKACEARLKKIIDIAEKMPIFEADAEWAKSMKNRVSARRQAIKDNAKRRGL